MAGQFYREQIYDNALVAFGYDPNWAFKILVLKDSRNKYFAVLIQYAATQIVSIPLQSRRRENAEDALRGLLDEVAKELDARRAVLGIDRFLGTDR